MKLRNLFWPITFVFLLACAPRDIVMAEPPASGDMVAVPKGDIEALYAAHQRMRARINELEQQAQACAASFNGMHRPGPVITKE